MNKKIIDKATYPRIKHFEHFNNYAYPYVGATVNVDITVFLHSIKERKIRFFPAFLYYITKALNSIPQFRQRIIGEDIVEYEYCIPAFTLALENDTYCNCQADITLPFEAFLQNVQTNEEKAKKNPQVEDEGDIYSLYFMSCVPWLSFVDITQPVPSPADSIPRIVWGKYYVQDQRTVIPINVLCNHSLVDGLHISRFFQTLALSLQSVCY